jgi:hypothetical protein
VVVFVVSAVALVSSIDLKINEMAIIGFASFVDLS